MNYHNITTDDMNNGSGLRVVLWLSGCSHKCRGCQNPQTWDVNSGIPFDKTAKEELFRELDKDYISGLTLSGGDPLFESNLDGVLDLVTEINKRYNLPQYIDDERKGGHNISNGNVNKIRLLSPKKTIWLYTGYTTTGVINQFWLLWPNIVTEKMLRSNEFIKEVIHQNKKRSQIISKCDVLVDGRYIDSQRDITLPYRGSKNQRLINIPKSLQKGEIVLWQT